MQRCTPRISSQLPFLLRCVGTCDGHGYAVGSFRSNRQIAALRWEAASWTCLRDGERIGALNPLLQRWGAACPSWRSPPWSPAPSSRWRYFRGSGENGSRIAAGLTPSAALWFSDWRPADRPAWVQGRRDRARAQSPACHRLSLCAKSEQGRADLTALSRLRTAQQATLFSALLPPFFHQHRVDRHTEAVAPRELGANTYSSIPGQSAASQGQSRSGSPTIPSGSSPGHIRAPRARRTSTQEAIHSHSQAPHSRRGGSRGRGAPPTSVVGNRRSRTQARLGVITTGKTAGPNGGRARSRGPPP
jgi:hypothetical protein